VPIAQERLYPQGVLVAELAPTVAAVMASRTSSTVAVRKPRGQRGEEALRRHREVPSTVGRLETVEPGGHQLSCVPRSGLSRSDFVPCTGLTYGGPALQ
jgi:hypothetical protein